MKKEVANLWIAALRSGNYKQGIGVLRDLDNNYCVLGVLSELAVQQKGVNRELDKTSFMYNGHRESLPPAVVEWAKMRNPHGFCPQVNKSLITLNDNGKSFDELATLISNHWKDL